MYKRVSINEKKLSSGIIYYDANCTLCTTTGCKCKQEE